MYVYNQACLQFKFQITYKKQALVVIVVTWETETCGWLVSSFYTPTANPILMSGGVYDVCSLKNKNNYN